MSSEQDLLEGLKHAASGSSEDHQRRRIRGLEELNRRLASGSVQNIDETIGALIELSRKQGNGKPEVFLIADSLCLLIEKENVVFRSILERVAVRGDEQEEGRLFIVLSELVSRLNHEEKRQAIAPLVRFLITRSTLNSLGTNEVYSRLVSLGSERLDSEIVKHVSEHLDALELPAIVFSVRLCSKFAGSRLSDRMLNVLNNSRRGYFAQHHTEIEKDICEFLGRIKDESSLDSLLGLLKARSEESYGHISRAIASIVDAHRYRMDELLDALWDAGRERKLVDAILDCLEEMKIASPDARRLLSRIRTSYWSDHPTDSRVRRVLVKGGKSSKLALLELMKDSEKCDFALECLKEIGISRNELSEVFHEPPMMQVYNFLRSQPLRKRAETLDSIWADKERLGNPVSGSTSRLEHLLVHILTGFNLVTINAAPLSVEGVDIVAFNPETLDLLIIGCTTGVLKDDLEKLDAIILKMEAEIPKLTDTCTVTPVLIYSKIAAISPSHEKYAREQEIAILQDYNIDHLLEMLNTNRETKLVLEYIKERVYGSSLMVS